MKKNLLIGFVLLFSTLFCIPAAMAEMPGSDASALWNYITKVSPYQQWSFWPDHQGMQNGRAPHGPKHKVYVNDKALSVDAAPLPDGSIQVKENFNMAGELKAITVMYKIKGYNPGDGDWFWVKYLPNGNAAKSGKPAGCIGCHGTRANNDFVVVHDLK
ncbi:MAG: cytochrome P460 family protein [Deltaproteobacteria bacterium]|nr:cytochrome P460 family protein [Deltaproteobacteria bacterium]